MNISSFQHWLASMLPGTVAAQTTRGSALQRAVRRLLRLVLMRIPALLANSLRHWRLLRTLASPPTAGLLRRHPQLAFKPYGGNYLALNMNARTRLDALLHHYAFVQARLHAGFLEAALSGRLVLWHDAVGDRRFAATLCFPRSPHHADRFADHEGDLALTFAMDGVPLYALCFSIVPGHIVRLDVPDAVFIGRLQGADGRFDAIREATRLLHDISPRDILLTVLQGMARALDIRMLAGVSNAEQLSKSRGIRRDEVLFDYDGFWHALHAQRTIDNLFVLPLPLAERPIDTIAQKHRSRTLRKRRYKDGVCVMACNAFRVQCLADERIRTTAALEDLACWSTG
jgi:uncharacterized protein VirK/YbjX